MTEPLYIWIESWGDFQHYKDRDPKWIKNYTRILNHDDYMGLTFSERGILHGIWLEYASSARRLRGDTLTLTRRLGQKVSKRNIETLVQAGFIQLLASDLLAELEQNASPEIETEKEVEKDKPVPAPAPEANYDGAGAGTGNEQTELGPHTVLRRLKGAA